MTLRNAGILRKLPDDYDLYLIINDTRVTLRGEKIPPLLSGSHPLSGYQQPLIPHGSIKTRPRRGRDDVLDIEFDGLSFTVKLSTFEAVWSGRMPWCVIWEVVPDIWASFRQEVTA